MTTDFRERYRSLSDRMQELGERHGDVMEGFRGLHKAAIADGALDMKTKELLALAIGIAVHCDGCITYHVHDALKAGASEQEITETIGVAVMMGGGPSVVYGCDALAALDQWERDPEFAKTPMLTADR